MGDHQLRVGQRFELPHHPGMIATLQEELSDERWRVHWTLGGGEACCTSVSIQSWIATRGWVPIEAYEAPKLGAVGTVPAAELADMRELHWWRNEFLPRVDVGASLKPLSSLAGRRFRLVQDNPEAGKSIHIGVDLADGPSKTIISVVKDGAVVAYARVDVVEEVKKLDAYLTDFYPNAALVLEREAHRLVRTLRTGPIPPIAPVAEAKPWAPAWDEFDFLKP